MVSLKSLLIAHSEGVYSRYAKNQTWQEKLKASALCIKQGHRFNSSLQIFHIEIGSVLLTNTIISVLQSEENMPYNQCAKA